MFLLADTNHEESVLSGCSNFASTHEMHSPTDKSLVQRLRADY